MLYHIATIGNFVAFPETGPFQIIRNGWMGVDLFFVISGFVITLSLSREDLNDLKKARINFMTRRWYRIAPLYYFTIVIFISFLQPHLLFLSAKSIAAHFGSHAIFLHNLIPQTHGSIVGPNWTVALEMQFYLLMAFLIVKIFGRNNLKVLLVMIVCSWSWRLMTTFFLEPGSSNPRNQSILSNMLPGTLHEFSVGILIAILWINSQNEESKLRKYFEIRLNNFFLYSCSFVILFGLNLTLLKNTNYWSSVYMIVFFKTSLAISFGLLLMAIISLKQKNHLIGKLLKYLGKISYGIYLWHIIVLSTVLDRMPWLAGYKLMLIVTGITLILSIMSYHLMEKPMIASGHLKVMKKNNKA